MSLRKQRNKKSHKGKHHDQCKEEKEIESDEPCEKELTELLEKFQNSVTVDNSEEIDPLSTTQVFSYIEQDYERSGGHQSVEESACHHNIEKIVAHGSNQSDKTDGQQQSPLNKINVTNFEDNEGAQATYSLQPFAEAFGFIRQRTLLPPHLIDGGQTSNQTIVGATCCKELLEQQHGCDCKCGTNSLGPQLAANPINKTESNSCVTKPTPRSNTRRKEDKNVDSVLKMLKSYGSIEEKFEALIRKYADISEENRRNQLASKQMEKQIISLQREKDILQADHSKTVLTRSRLENLCRELQRQNKSIKDESLLKIREEEEKRKEMSNKFQTTLTEVTALIEQNKEKNLKLREENCEIAERFANVYKQYEQRDQQLEKLTKQMQLEMQLSEARMAKSRMEMAAEKEKLLQEKHTLLLEVSKLQGKLKEMAENERQLRSQVSLYTDKYSDFQSALTKSNDVFANFKAEMDKMTKKIVKLEKEITTWRQRWESTHDKLAEALVERQKFSVEAFSATRKAVRLQKLCRALQDDRATLIKKLRAAEASESTQEDNNDMKDYIKNVSKKLDNEVLKVFNIDFAEEIEADNIAGDRSNSEPQIETDNTQELEVNNIQNVCGDPKDMCTQSVPNSPVPNDSEHGTIEDRQPPLVTTDQKKKKSNKKKSK